MSRSISRRRFIQRTAIAGAGAAVAWKFGVFRTLSQWVDVSRSKVALLPCGTYDEALLDRTLSSLLDAAALPPVVGKRVVLKPNFVDHFEDRPVETDARLILATVRQMKRRGAREVIVAEGPGNRNDLVPVLDSSGLLAGLRKEGASFQDLNYDDLDRLRTRVVGDMDEPSLLESLLMSRTLTGADLIVSMPKLKTHHHVGVTLSLKNLFGTVPGVKYGWPKNLLHWNGIDRSILEIYGTLRDHTAMFAIVDGVIGMEGDGPLHGVARQAGVLVAGSDLAAVDAVSADVMGVDAAKVAHLQAAQLLGLGRIDFRRIERVGEPPAYPEPFELPEKHRGLRRRADGGTRG